MKEEKPVIIHITWEDVLEDTKKLVSRLQKKGISINHIVGVARGGLVPATLIAEELHIHMIDTICIKTYQNTKSSEASGVLKALSLPHGGKNVLVIDDLADSGLTMMYVRKMLPNAHFAVLYTKPEGTNLVDTFVAEVPQNSWLIYPWEDPDVDLDDCLREGNIN